MKARSVDPTFGTIILAASLWWMPGCTADEGIESSGKPRNLASLLPGGTGFLQDAHADSTESHADNEATQPGGTEFAHDKANGLLLVSQQSSAETFIWSTSNSRTKPDVYMRPTSTHVCYLSRVTGNFNGAAADVHHNTKDMYNVCSSWPYIPGALFPALDPANDVGPTWKIGGCQTAHDAGLNDTLTIEATCFPGSSFIVDAGGVVTGSNLFAASRTSCGTTTTNMWPGLAVSFLSGVHGHFTGGGEAAKIVPDSTSKYANPQKLTAQTQFCGDPFVVALGYSMFAGDPNRIDVAPSARSTRYAVSHKGASDPAYLTIPSTVKMLRTRDAACYLTSVSGDFRGGAERLRIYPKIDGSGVEYWMLEAISGSGGVYGNAECIYYDQRVAVLQ